MSKFVELRDVRKIYQMGEVEIRAVDGIDFCIDQGEFVVVVGPSGAGKTTVLNILGGMDTASSGEVWVDGNNVAEYSNKELTRYRRDDIGFVFQFYNLIPVLNAEENILLPLQLDGQLPDREYLEDILMHFDLTGRRTFLPNQLSGGQQQRVAVARALIHKPALIMADEPTGNLDTKNSREIISLMTSCVRRYGQTMVLITHDPSIAAQADRVIKIEDGRILEG